MPRLSLYRPHKSKDYLFIDRTVYEQFQVGGVDVYVHKYIGPVDPTDSSKSLGESTIQDLVFLENRDRKYSQDVLVIRGHYPVQDLDFNLSQFALLLDNDNLYMTIHINNSVDLIGRKIMSGDVFELPNLKDEYALNDFDMSLKRFYVVEGVTRAAEGFSPTWYPHLYRVKLKPMTDSQEFKDILERPADSDIYAGDYDPTATYYPGQVVKYNGKLYMVKTDGSVGPEGTKLAPPDLTAWEEYTGPTIGGPASQGDLIKQISNSVVAEAEADALKSGYETSHFYTLAVDPITGQTLINSADSPDNVASDFIIDIFNDLPIRDGYTGYLLEDGIAPNFPLTRETSQFGHGIQFPIRPFDGDYFLRTDYLPNRLFRFSKDRWVRQEDNVRMTLSNTDDRQTLKTSFINNTATSGIGRTASDVILVKADGTVQYESGDTTTLFQLLPIGAYIVTTVPYNKNYKVEVWLDEEVQAPRINTVSTNGFLAFTIGDSLLPNTRIRYTIFEHSVVQQQFPSKALKKFKPTADN